MDAYQAPEAQAGSPRAPEGFENLDYDYDHGLWSYSWLRIALFH